MRIKEKLVYLSYDLENINPNIPTYEQKVASTIWNHLKDFKYASIIQNEKEYADFLDFVFEKAINLKSKRKFVESIINYIT